MGYDSPDLIILDEMLTDVAKIKLTGNYSKKQVILTESHGSNYSVTIKGIPENTIVIKTDLFPPPKAIFQGKKGECKRCDFVIVSDHNSKKVILFIEMKASKCYNSEVIKQLKGGECLIFYCQKIGKLFWNNANFLDKYDCRFIAFTNLLLDKKPTKYQKQNILNNLPENMLKIAGQKIVQFNRLTGK